MNGVPITIGGCHLFLGDCLEIIPKLSGVDAIVSDPPYGIGFDYSRQRARKSGLRFADHSRDLDRNRYWSNIVGDDRPFDPTPFLGFSEVILWGANNYSHLLPASRGWLVWDKLDGKTPSNFGDCELAWTNKDSVTRVYRHLWRGLVRKGEENVSNGPKLHPAQKPVDLMKWCIGFVDGTTVLDPFMGCGSTAIACMRAGKRFVGIEVDPEHFETAVERVKWEAGNPGKPFRKEVVK